MQIYIALLRGINVGGHHKIPMASLREMLEHLNFSNVRTYIQSGNIVFQYSLTSVALLEEKIATAITKTFGFSIPVIVKTQTTFTTVFVNCPFKAKKQKESSYFTLLQKLPKQEDIEALKKIQFPNEQFFVYPDAIYGYSSAGYARVKANNNFFEKKLKVAATTRNYKTMQALLKLAESLK